VLIVLAAALTGCGGEDAPQEGGKNDANYYHDFGEVVVGLRTPKPPSRHLRITFTFEIDGADEDAAREALEDKQRAIRDGMLLFLSEQSIEKLNEKETLERIRTEVRKIANQHLDRPFVKRVFLDDMAVQ